MRWQRSQINNDPNLKGIRRTESECGRFVIVQLRCERVKGTLEELYRVEVLCKGSFRILLRRFSNRIHYWQNETSAKKYVARHFKETRMKFTVYHFDMEKYCCLLGHWMKYEDGKRVDCGRPAFSEYKKVAVVEAEDIDAVFELTNHIDSDWTENPGVVAEPGRHRSTSVGDIIVDENGKGAICASLGWEDTPLD